MAIVCLDILSNIIAAKTTVSGAVWDCDTVGYSSP
jgi:hypothetical protein